MMRMTQSTKEGWEKIGRKHYRHTATGSQVKYNHNTFRWELFGGPNDGEINGLSFSVLWAAMYHAAKTPAEFIR